jgi:hypothetical protein
MSQPDTERIIQEFVGENPRAAEWRALRQALLERLQALRRQRRQEVEDGADAPRLRSLDTQIAALDRQVAALETEEAVAQFVEDSIKVTVAKSMIDEEG